MSKNIIIIGAGGHGNVISDIVKKNGDTVYGFLDDDISKKNVIGPIEDCIRFSDMQFVIAIGNNQIRKKIAEKYSLSYYTAVHPSAIIADDVRIGEGTVVMANAVINTNAVIGKHCIINTSSVVEHDNDISDYVHVSPGAVLCGTVRVGTGTHIGAATVVKNNITIERDVVIGCGGCVVKDIVDSGFYAGIPVEKMEREK